MMNWKQTNETEARAVYMGVEVVRVHTPNNLYYYLVILPAIRFVSEGEVKYFIERKHRAA